MENLTLEKYLKDKQEIRFLYNSFKNIGCSNDVSVLLGRISFFLTSSKEYASFQSYIKVAELTVAAIKDFEEYGSDEFKAVLSDLEGSLNDFLSELSTNIQLDVYFYGEDTYNLLNRKYLNLNVYKLNDFYEVNYIKKNKNLKHHFTVLLLEESVTFASDLGIENIFDEVFDYNKLINQVFQVSDTLYKCDYDFNYLKNRLEDVKHEDVRTIIVGNGYARAGIDEKALCTRAVNLSLSSQDLHYSFALAKKAIEQNPNINKCIIGVGYYSMYYNLNNIQKKSNSKDIAKELYEPILNPELYECKNSMSLEHYITNPITLELFNMDELTTYTNSINQKLNPNYFNDDWSRESNSVLKNQNFDLMHSDDKSSIGIWRASQHNKFIDGFNKSQKALLVDFFDYLESKGVAAVLTVLPTTNYYNRFLDERYKQVFEDTIKELEDKCKFKVIDFNKDYEFNDSDFIDVDHLNEIGCAKVTSYLSNVIKWLNN